MTEHVKKVNKYLRRQAKGSVLSNCRGNKINGLITAMRLVNLSVNMLRRFRCCHLQVTDVLSSQQLKIELTTLFQLPWYSMIAFLHRYQNLPLVFASIKNSTLLPIETHSKHMNVVLKWNHQ
jgi:hypothetical protein